MYHLYSLPIDEFDLYCPGHVNIRPIYVDVAPTVSTATYV